MTDITNFLVKFGGGIMKHIIAFLVKLAMITLLLTIVLGALTDLTFTGIFYVSFAVAAAAYIIGDLWILSLSNNIIAAIGDFVLSLVVIYAFNFLWNLQVLSFSDAMISAAVIAVGEWFFHKYIAVSIFPKHKDI